jgi:hypothetical protein
MEGLPWGNFKRSGIDIRIIYETTGTWEIKPKRAELAGSRRIFTDKR